MRAYQRAANAHDLETVLAMIAEDAIFLYGNQPAHIGKDAIRKAVAANFAAVENEKYRAHHVTWLASGDDVALCVYLFDWTGEIGGKPVSGAGRGTTALRRVADAWRIIHEHLSEGPL